MKNILSLNYEEAKAFLLKSESYLNIDLPAYINFENLLLQLSVKLDKKHFNSIKKKNPDKIENVNYTLLHNKNGKYEWRPFELIHPVLYISLVNQITNYKNWKYIKRRFGKIRAKSFVECMSLPIISISEKSDKAEQILNWWEKIEQKSLELSLDFNYIYHTDITDCYGSIYTHSIAWALHSKEIAKLKQKDNKLIGNLIDGHIQAMSFGQTNGIPQGSVLMDFIAEIILSYADLNLSTKIAKKFTKKDFKILRYRDDYRIFTNNPTDAEEVIKILTEVLMDLGLKLHAQKTINFSNVIQGSIKPDKLNWLINKKDSTTIQKQLLILHEFSNSYPNSGTLTKELQNIFNKIKKQAEGKENKELLIKKENINVLISITVDIAYHNPRTYPISLAILSKLFSLIENKNDVENIAKKVIKKFSSIPNTGYMQIWLQRAIIKLDCTKFELDEKLCKLINGNKVEIWNNEWLHNSISDIFDKYPIIDTEKIKDIDEVISDEEVLLFGIYSS